MLQREDKKLKKVAILAYVSSRYEEFCQYTDKFEWLRFKNLVEDCKKTKNYDDFVELLKDKVPDDDDDVKYIFWLMALSERDINEDVNKFISKELDQHEKWFCILVKYYNNFAIKSKKNFKLVKSMIEKSSSEDYKEQD